MTTIIPKVNTGIQQLDEMLFGGLYQGSATLLEGAAGTGKTNLGVQFLMEGMQKGESALIVTFEEYPEQYYSCALELGWDLKAMEEKGLLELIFTTPENFMQMVDEDDQTLSQIIEEKDIKRALIDSVTHFEKLAPDQGNLRHIETNVVNFFKREEITTLLLKENKSILGGWNVSNNKVSFIVDCYIILRYLELESEIKRAIMVLKMRGSNHQKEIRQYEITDKGIVVGEIFKGISGIFLGTGRPSEKK
ncbi:MAG: ATPase [Fibrobacteria bacterium]|nr:ATPase [Fibrobacteria bacterium]